MYLLLTSSTLIFLLMSSVSFAAYQSSANYTISRDVIDSDGPSGSSTNYNMYQVMAQSSAIGPSLSAGYSNYGGFWYTMSFRVTTGASGTGSGTVTSAPAGIDCGADCSENYNYITPVSLTATADAGSTFAGWSVEDCPVSGPCTPTTDCPGSGACNLTIDSEKAVTATFTINSYTVSCTPSGNGSCSCTSPVIYNSNSTCTVTADPNYHIVSVAGDTCSVIHQSGDTYVAGPVTSACNVTATFAIDNNTLTVNPQGAGSGSVTSNTGNISCNYNGIGASGTCSDSYPYGSTVTLTASPAPGSRLIGWSGCDAPLDNACDMTMNGNKTVTANFALITTATITSETGGSISLTTNSPGCGLSDVQSLTEAQVANDPSYNYPFGLVSFKISCSQADVTLTFDAAGDLSSTYVYRKYGPTTPGAPNTAKWYTFSALISGNSVTLHLVDGQLGDDTGVDGIIVDAGGPALSQPLPIPAMDEWGMIIFLLLAGLGAIFYLRRQKSC